MAKKVIVIGSGFAGLSGATSLADKGYDVTLLEKNSSAGGRARVFRDSGFTYDMGPSWYWMPEVFEQYFNRFGKKTSDYYNLVRLDPSYRVVFGENDFVDVPASIPELKKLFESYEVGSGEKLEQFLKQAEYKYIVGMNDFVQRPSRSYKEFIDYKIVLGLTKLDMLLSFSKHVRKYFSHPKILKIMEFPVLFLGATPEKTPALYSMMNYADLSMGTWYPMGGMYKIIEGMVSLAQEKGVKFQYNAEVLKIVTENNQAKKVVTTLGEFEADIVLAGGDYHHVETELLEESNRSYDSKYWDQRVMSPSSLIFYLGINKKVNNLLHHNLFFDTDFSKHAKEIYESPQWPSNPLFYVSAPSKTDSEIMPEGCENLFILIPVAPDLEDTEEIREKYFQVVMERLEKITGETIKEHIVYKRGYAHKDFKSDYHAFKGNAYGLANTLNQTALFKPALKSKKVKNLFYTGQLTVPGPGVPPALISGQLAASEICKEFNYV
jgi:phytoene desaturase